MDAVSALPLNALPSTLSSAVVPQEDGRVDDLVTMEEDGGEEPTVVAGDSQSTEEVLRV